MKSSSVVLHVDINDSKNLLFINFMTHMKKIGLKIRYPSIYVAKTLKTRLVPLKKIHL